MAKAIRHAKHEDNENRGIFFGCRAGKEDSEGLSCCQGILEKSVSQLSPPSGRNTGVPSACRSFVNRHGATEDPDEHVRILEAPEMSGPYPAN